MKRQYFWWITVLTSLAVIGLIGIQIYWLNFYVTLNEQQFENTVQDVMIRVKDEIEEYDDQQLEAHRKMIRGQQKVSRPLLRNTDSLAYRELEDDFLRRGLLDVRRATNTMHIADRVHPEKLNKWLRNAIEDKGITIGYDYGVYSASDDDFVIVNGHYVRPKEDQPKASIIPMEHSRMSNTLRSSKYIINLFNDGIYVSGMLVLHFPERATFIWASLIPMLLLIALFIAIILFAFIYSLNVILRQKKLSEMKNDFINNMTHEFKTPIATISLATDSITSDKIAGNPDRVSRFAKIIKQENKRMLGQVEKVLQMAQLERGKIELQWEQVDLHELILRAKENFDLVVRARDGELSVDLQSSNPVLMSDENHLANVIHNLLDNANKYSPETPIIQIRTRDKGGQVELSITDRGQGMTKEQRRHIFDKFYRVHTGNRHDVKGFGLGLSYVKAIVKAHHGQINVKSELGSGSTFILSLPRVHQDG